MAGIVVVGALVIAAAGIAYGVQDRSASGAAAHTASRATIRAPSTGTPPTATNGARPTTTAVTPAALGAALPLVTVPSAPPSTTTTTSAPAPSGAGVTTVGDSVMLDYQTALEADLPGITVQATVSRQWTAGDTVLRYDRAAGQLGSTVVIGLGTNGPITTTDFNTMMSLLTGVKRVVFVTVVVDRPWQTANNAVLAAGVAHHPNAVLADWHALDAQNPGWVYPTTGTHLPINGPGAQALAALVAGKVDAAG